MIEPVGTRQVAGLILSESWTRILAYRWTVERDRTTFDDATGVLTYHVPTVAVPLLKEVLAAAAQDQEPIAVQRLCNGHVSPVGMFLVLAWQDPVLRMKRMSDAEVTVDGRNPTIPDVLAHWGLDVLTGGVVSCTLGDSLITPDGIMFHGLHADLIDWFGPNSRLTPHCMLYAADVYPPRQMFTAARTLAQEYQFPVVIVFGEPSSPLQPDALVTNCGLQVIAFQPVTGHTRRVHFHNADGRVLLCAGELGEMD